MDSPLTVLFIIGELLHVCVFNLIVRYTPIRFMHIERMHVHVCMYIGMYIGMYVYINTYTYIYIYMHILFAYIHTCIYDNIC